MIIEQLRILPLGGLGEIGMNCMLLEWKNEVILIDCGIQFADPSYTGIELLAPDFSFLRKKLKKIKGVIVTHGHEDHIGAIPYLAREVPLNIYTTPFPRGLLAEKFTEFSKLKEVKFHEIKPREKFTVGSFTFDPIPVAHSIIESLAISIETPVGTLIHTGDFKHDANELGDTKFDFKPFEQIGKKGVRLLMSDSTNAERTGHTLSERDITKSFEKILKEQNTRIIIGLFASNIRRVENLLKVAGKLGKKVALAGRSMHTYTKLAHEQLSLTIPVDTLVAIEDTHKYPDDQVVVLVTGSQAEPGSALMRMSQGTHNTFSIKPNDSIILSSRFIPGNERAITRMIDDLYRMGADVMYESIHQIHVSGHGFQEELLMMLNATKPENFVPIHGEFRHLKKHSLLAKKTGVDEKKIFVIENGQSILIDGEVVKYGDKVELKKTAIVDGYLIEGSEVEYTQRMALSKSGVVFAVCLVDSHKLELAVRPRVHFHGLLFKQGENPEKVIEEARDILEDIFLKIKNLKDFEEKIKMELKTFFKKKVSHKPVIMPMVFEI